MRKTITFLILQLVLMSQLNAQTYNRMSIPPRLFGYRDTINHTYKKTYNLLMRDGVKQFFNSGNQTITAGFTPFTFDSLGHYVYDTSDVFLGPTLEMNLGDSIQMNVINLLNDSSTVHWHGIHLPAIMDGGPHQVIPHGTIWQPYWTVSDSASTYWYHPHMDSMTENQVAQGLTGLIIVNSPTESALALPRTYGVDDIPLIITDRSFDSNHQFIISPPFGLGDTIIANGVINAEYPVPAQVVRFRILDVSIAMLYKLGFRKPDGTNIPFSVIGSDGGLLDGPAPADTFLIAPGQRTELLLNLTGVNPGDSFDLVAYNNTLDSNQNGGKYNPAQDGLLSGTMFPILHLKVVAQTTTTPPVTTIPATLAHNEYLNPAAPGIDSVKSMALNFGVPLNDTSIHFGFLIDDSTFDMHLPYAQPKGTINKTIKENATVIWTIIDTFNHNPAINAGVNHVFHIHDIQFHILSRNALSGAPLPLTVSDSGRKDDVRIDMNTSLTFITQFKDFADPKWPYMYHCHMLDHEDGGMMGQFVVVKDATGTKNLSAYNEPVMKIFPNPVSERFFIELEDKSTYVYYATIFDVSGRTKYMLPSPQLKDGINLTALKPGNYFITIKDSNGNSTTKKFIKL